VNKLTRISYKLMVRAVTVFERSMQSVSAKLRYYLVLQLAFDPRDDDVYIVSYPKAGTTVLQMMLYQMTTNGSMHVGHIDEVAPWFESHILRDSNHLNRMPSPRIFKTHLTFRQLPKQGRRIFLVRNPKDSCVSLYHHLRSLHGDRSSMAHFVRTFNRGFPMGLSVGSWFKHLRVCLSGYPNNRVLLINYDDLTRKLAEVVDRVALFCDVDLTETKRQEVIERCEIDFMRRYNSKFDPRLSDTRSESATFIRTGQAGTWVNELTPRMSSDIDHQLFRSLRTLARRVCDDVAFLKVDASPCKGVIAVTIEGKNGDRFLRNSLHTLPFAVFVGLRGIAIYVPDAIIRLGYIGGYIKNVIRDRLSALSGLKIDDCVKLSLNFSPPIQKFVGNASVSWIGVHHGVPGVVLRFATLSDDQKNILNQICLMCGEDLLCRDMDLLLHISSHKSTLKAPIESSTQS